MTILVESYLPLPAGEAWQLVKRSQTLIFVTRGIIGFRPGDFPAIWQQGQLISTRLYAFGLIPLWKHSLKFERIDDDRMELSTSESGGLISVWNHLIKIEKESETMCKYSDKVEIRAGILTPLVCLFAQAFYLYRQRRWKLMVDKTD